MKQATVIQNFHDIKDGTLRTIGGVFLVDEARGRYLKDLGLVTLRDAPEPAPKKKSTRKK